MALIEKGPGFRADLSKAAVKETVAFHRFPSAK
jgi:hypothetical protein